MKTLLRYLLIAFLLTAFLYGVNAQNTTWKKIKPSNTGIPGSLVRLLEFDHSGNLWVAARWPFWGEGGISKFDGTKWTAYSNVDSWMPSDIVNSVAFQQTGITWIGTDSGLIRFDGVNAVLFNMSNAPFPSNNILSVEIDGNGNVWFISKSVTTTAHAVIKYDGSNWTIYNSSNSGIPYFDITTLGIDQNNNIWVGTWALGIARFNGSQWTVYNSTNSGYNGGEVSDFAFAANGDVWVTSSGYGIYKFSNNTWQHIPGLPGNYSYSTVEIHPEGQIWFGTYNGLLVKYDGNSFVSFMYGNHLYSIDFDNSGNVWAAGLAGVKKYVGGVNTLTYNSSNTALTSFFVDAIDFQLNGTAWFATSMGGVCRFDGTVWSGFNPNNAGSQPWTFLNNSANDVFVDKQNGNIWVASNGVGYWNGTSWNIYTLTNSNIPDNDVEVVNKDLSGRIWIGTGGYGAAYFYGSVWTRLDFGPYSSNTINDIAVAPDGSIWFASDFGLHKTTDGTNYTSYFTSNSLLPSDYINTVTFEANGTMWIGSTEGLTRVTNNTWVTFNESNSGLPANFVSDIEASVTGIIWVSAHNTQTWPYYGGIAKYNGTTWTTYTPVNSPLSHLQVKKLKFDPAGNLWVSTYSEGLVKLLLGTNAPLPVTFFDFTGEKITDAVALKWSTSFDTKTEKFIIERAGINGGFEAIGSREASTSNQNVINYHFTDINPIVGKNYYRIKVIDIDDNISYSKTIMIEFYPGNPKLVLYPNPARNFIIMNFEGSNEDISIRIYDLNGKLVKQQMRRGQSDLQIDISALHPGTYILRAENSTTSLAQKFMKIAQ